MATSQILAQTALITKTLKGSSKSKADILLAKTSYQSIMTGNQQEREFVQMFVDVCSYMLGTNPRALVGMIKFYREFFIRELDLKS